MKTGRKWNPQEAVHHAQGVLQYRDIIGQVQSGTAGFGLGDSWKPWCKATFERRRQMVTSFVRKQEAETWPAAVAMEQGAMDELA